MTATVVATYGTRYLVELASGERLKCVVRANTTAIACGDVVKVSFTSAGEGVIDNLLPRHHLLQRSSPRKIKLIAANVTQALIVLAPYPSFYETLLNSYLTACVAANIKAIIVLNKCDLCTTTTQSRLTLYQDLGYTTLLLSAKYDIAPLKPYLQGQTTVLLGQSGMGKSTIINALIPGLEVRTQDMSIALDSGKHTTTATHLYRLNVDTSIIDAPGIQEFGLFHVNASALQNAFIEFKPYLGQCRFSNCQHLQEPDCAILAATSKGLIANVRLACYQALREAHERAYITTKRRLR